MKTHSPTPAAPDETASYAQDGLTAEFYRGRQDAVSDQAVIILGGSDGNFKTTQQFAAAFADHGLNTLALPYYGQPHLPKDLAQIPVETVETAAGWLHRRGFTRIGIWGISMGAQLALLAASLIPAIGRVAAVSPLDVCVQGLQVSPRKRLLDCSAFTWRGQDLPYCPLRMNRRRVWRDSLKSLGLNMRSCYRSVAAAAEEARIKIENINGAILLLTAGYDLMWPAHPSAQRMMRRLQRKHFAHPYSEQSYLHAGHFLFPDLPHIKKPFAATPLVYAKEHARSSRDAFEATVRFFREWAD